MAEKIYDAYHQEIQLTDEQEACLKYSGSRTLMVKGYAGAGKSIVLMTLAMRYLQKYGADIKNKVAIFTFQNTLVSSTKEILIANGAPEDGVVVTTVNSHIKQIYDFLVQYGFAPRRRFPYSGKGGDNQRLTNVKNAIRAHQTKYGKHRFHNIDPEFWLEEFDWMKDMNVWKDDLSMYMNIPRRGRGGKVRMSTIDRAVAYQLYTCYLEQLERANQGDWIDQALYIIRHPELIPEGMKFDHILIDEAQDLSLTQMMAIMTLYRQDMGVAMDMNQRIFSKHWTPKQLGIETTTKKLTKSMRTTKEIDALAESVRSKNDELLSEDDKNLRAIPEKNGKRPQLIHLEDAAAEKKCVVNLVEECLSKNDRITIGIIAAKNRQIPTYAEWLASENIEHEHINKDSTFSMAKPGVKIVSAFGAKGLEFDIVIIPMFAEGNFPYGYQPDDEEAYDQYMIKMRNLVYVSMTRARRELYITFWGDKGSRFIKDMDPALYDLKGEMPDIKVPVFVPKSTGEAASGDKDGEIEVEPKRESESRSNLRSGSGRTDARTDGSMRVETGKSSSQKQEGGSELVNFLKSKGLSPIDKRDKGGALWVVGDKSLDPILQGSRKKFGALWGYTEKGGAATKRKPGWYTKSDK